MKKSKETIMSRNIFCFQYALLALVTLTPSAVARARVLPARVFQSGMVLQRHKPIVLWGTADKGETFNVSFRGKTIHVTADGNGHWQTVLPQQKAGGPYRLIIDRDTLRDILVGDVWLCSGQSNMDVTVARVAPQYPGETETYSNDRVRLLRVDQKAAVTGPQTDFHTTGWKALTPQSAANFSAIGYFLGRKREEETGVPQGIICNSWGGTPIEAWVPEDSLSDYPRYLDKLHLYTPQYVETQNKANALMNNRWTEELNSKDPGLKEGWTGFCDDSRWKEYNQYDRSWAQQNGRGIIGSVWMRQHVHIDKAHDGMAALLLLGTLYDADYTYINGQQVGVTYYQYPPRRYNIPAGLLHEGDNVLTIRFINKGGTASFTPGKLRALVFANGDTTRLGETWRSHLGTTMPAMTLPDTGIQNLATVMYNSMLYPLAPMTIAGAVWYQGESNTDRPNEYLPMLRKLKNSWRTLFNDKGLPFVIVQLANFLAPSDQPQETGWAGVREAQRLGAQEDPHAALAVTIDLGEWNDIHPLRKREVADRVSRAFDRCCFGKNMTLSPEPVRAKTTNGTVVVTFDQKLKGGNIHECELAGADHKFHNASAEARGNELQLTCPEVPVPRFVRYAWKNNPAKANLQGINGLPATPFQAKTE